MKALILTDIQHDFMPGGALGVPKANEIIETVNHLMEFFDVVFATQDWHPPRHISFASTHGKKVGEVIHIGKIDQILWPDHCIQNTRGAELSKGLKRDKIKAIFHKGVDLKVDSYSTFFDAARHRSTGLSDRLKKEGIDHLYFVGVATDYCVLYSVLDALDLGFQVTLIKDACRPINLHPDDEKKALRQMEEKGAKIVLSKNLFQ